MLTNPGSPFDEDGWADCLSDLRRIYLLVSGGANDLNANSESVTQGQDGEGVSATAGVGTFLQIANNLSDLGNVATARTNLGLGTMAVQNASGVAVTGGSISGTTYVSSGDFSISSGSITYALISGGYIALPYPDTLTFSAISAGILGGSTFVRTVVTDDGSSIVAPTASGGHNTYEFGTTQYSWTMTNSTGATVLLHTESPTVISLTAVSTQCNYDVLITPTGGSRTEFNLNAATSSGFSQAFLYAKDITLSANATSFDGSFTVNNGLAGMSISGSIINFNGTVYMTSSTTRTTQVFDVVSLISGTGTTYSTLSSVGLVLAAGGIVKIAGNQIITSRQSAVTAPTGGGTQDTQARTAINDIISRLQSHGLIS